MKKTKTLRTIICLLLVSFTGNVIFATVPPPVTGSAGPTCWPPPCIPVDNGVIFLIVAGTLFVAWKLYGTILKKTTPES